MTRLLLDVQRRYRELGRLRMGRRVSMGGGKSRPEKLDTWRLTSASKDLLERAASIYGGEVEPWPDAPGEGQWWQVTTTTASLPIAVPPGDVLTQYWELWSGGGCKKRCDGYSQILVDRRCSCPEDITKRLEKAKEGQACSPVTRFSVLLPDVPDVGVWRLETHGMNAAQEIPATYEILRQAATISVIIPARLTIQARQTKKEGKATQKFRVPVIEIEHTMHEMVAGLGQLTAGEGSQEVGQLPAGAPPAERKTMPGEAPPVSTDAGEPQTVEEAQWPEGTPPPAPPPPDVLPEWIVDLPGDDGEILDAAMDVAANRGKPREIKSLRELGEMKLTDGAKEAIRKRLTGEDDGPPEGADDAGAIPPGSEAPLTEDDVEPVQETLGS